MNGQSLCLFVPDSEKYDTYPRLVFELLTGLAEFEDRQASEIINDILLASHASTTNGISEASPSAEGTRK